MWIVDFFAKRQTMNFESYIFRFEIKSSEDVFDCDTSGSLFTGKEWRIEELAARRTELNQVKAKLQEFNLDQWDRHTEFTEISSNIKTKLFSKLDNPQIMTRAWIKFYEIISTFRLFNNCDGKLATTVLFQCEGLFWIQLELPTYLFFVAPGAFVSATNHYLKSKYNTVQFEWIATTLNPYYEDSDAKSVVYDDRFIRNPFLFQNWFFGPSNTGDILEDGYISSLKQYVMSRYKSHDSALFDLVTADGAFDCMSDFSRQEEMVFPLIHKEVIIGMEVLRNHGSMVIKFFTFFDCHTLSLLYVVCHCFDQVIAYKPVASKHGNSEMYLACLGFNRQKYQSISTLIQDVKSEDFILNRDLLSPKFIDQICRLTKEATDRQTSYIQQNIERFKSRQFQYAKFRKEIEKNKSKMADLFLRKFTIENIPVNEQFMLVYDNYDRNEFRLFRKILNSQKRDFDSKNFASELLKIIANSRVNQEVHWVNANSDYHYKIKVNFVHGRPYRTLNNSPFCSTSLFRAFILVCEFIDDSTRTNPFTPDMNCLISFFNHLNQVIFSKQSSFSSMVQDNLPLNIFYSESSELSLIHYVDLYDKISNITDNDFLSTFDLKDKLFEMFHNQRIKSSDYLIIRFKTLFSRLAVGLVYILSKCFARFTCFAQCTPLDSHHPSLFCIFKDFRSQTKELKEALEDTAKWKQSLLELVDAPTVISSKFFF